MRPSLRPGPLLQGTGTAESLVLSLPPPVSRPSGAHAVAVTCDHLEHSASESRWGRWGASFCSPRRPPYHTRGFSQDLGALGATASASCHRRGLGYGLSRAPTHGPVGMAFPCLLRREPQTELTVILLPVSPLTICQTAPGPPGADGRRHQAGVCARGGGSLPPAPCIPLSPPLSLSLSTVVRVTPPILGRREGQMSPDRAPDFTHAETASQRGATSGPLCSSPGSKGTLTPKGCFPAKRPRSSRGTWSPSSPRWEPARPRPPACRAGPVQGAAPRPAADRGCRAPLGEPAFLVGRQAVAGESPQRPPCPARPRETKATTTAWTQALGPPAASPAPLQERASPGPGHPLPTPPRIPCPAAPVRDTCQREDRGREQGPDPQPPAPRPPSSPRPRPPPAGLLEG